MSNTLRLQSSRQRPRVLIGSSCESASVADALRLSLQTVAEVSWRHKFNPLTNVSISGLVEALSSVDFAVFLLSREDADRMRQEKNTVARDNVLLQLGVALSALGQSRTLLVYPRNFRRDSPEFHVAVDVLGMTPAFYDQKGTHDYPAYGMGTAFSQIGRVLSRVGLRQAEPPAVYESTLREPSKHSDPSESTKATLPAAIPDPTPALSPGPVRIRFNTNRRKQDLRPDAQINVLKGWWEDLSEKQRRSIIRYAEVGRLLNFRSGTTRHYLRDIAEDSGYIADHEGESLVIYQPVQFPRAGEVGKGPSSSE